MIHRFAELSSTQDVAHRLGAEGAAHGTIVVAESQLHARGARGRGWSSERGGLWLTAILRPVTASAVECLSLRVGLAIAGMLGDRIGTLAAIGLKWPNDLIVRDRKVGGILTEARWIGDRPGWVAVGVGLNVANEIPGTLARWSIRLADLGVTDSADELVEPVASAIIEAARGAGPLTGAELARYAELDWLAGKRIDSPIEGTVAGVAADGRLTVILPDGQRTAVSGSITFAGLAANPPAG